MNIDAGNPHLEVGAPEHCRLCRCEIASLDDGVETRKGVICLDCAAQDDPRERDGDDGSTYGDPRDEMDERLLRDL